MASSRGFFENQSVKMATFAISVVFICGLVAGEVAWKTNMHRDIQDINQKIELLNDKIVGRTPNAWHRQDMLLWQLETEKLNPTWQGGDLSYRNQPIP